MIKLFFKKVFTMDIKIFIVSLFSFIIIQFFLPKNVFGYEGLSATMIIALLLLFFIASFHFLRELYHFWEEKRYLLEKKVDFIITFPLLGGLFLTLFLFNSDLLLIIKQASYQKLLIIFVIIMVVVILLIILLSFLINAASSIYSSLLFILFFLLFMSIFYVSWLPFCILFLLNIISPKEHRKEKE